MITQAARIVFNERRSRAKTQRRKSAAAFLTAFFAPLRENYFSFTRRSEVLFVQTRSSFESTLNRKDDRLGARPHTKLVEKI